MGLHPVIRLECHILLACLALPLRLHRPGEPRMNGNRRFHYRLMLPMHLTQGDGCHLFQAAYCIRCMLYAIPQMKFSQLLWTRKGNTDITFSPSAERKVKDLPTGTRDLGSGDEGVPVRRNRSDFMHNMP